MTDKVSGVMHVRPISLDNGAIHNKGGLSIAYSVRENGDVRMGVAVCSSEDNFNRRLGRTIATSRLMSSKDQDLVTTIEASVLEFLAQEVLGDDRKIKPERADSGEYFVPRSVFPLTTVLLHGSRPIFIGMIVREFNDLGYPVPDVLQNLDSIRIERIGNKLGFHFSDKHSFGERVL